MFTKPEEGPFGPKHAAYCVTTCHTISMFVLDGGLHQLIVSEHSGLPFIKVTPPWHDRWRLDYKGSASKWAWSFRYALPAFAWRVWRRPRHTSGWPVSQPEFKVKTSRIKLSSP